jgi:hypothetical protein
MGGCVGSYNNNFYNFFFRQAYIAERVAKAVNCQPLFFSFSQAWMAEREVLAVTC